MQIKEYLVSELLKYKVFSLLLIIVTLTPVNTGGVLYSGVFLVWINVGKCNKDPSIHPSVHP